MFALKISYVVKLKRLKVGKLNNYKVLKNFIYDQRIEKSVRKGKAMQKIKDTEALLTSKIYV